MARLAAEIAGDQGKERKGEKWMSVKARSPLQAYERVVSELDGWDEKRPIIRAGTERWQMTISKKDEDGDG